MNARMIGYVFVGGAICLSYAGCVAPVESPESEVVAAAEQADSSPCMWVTTTEVTQVNGNTVTKQRISCDENPQEGADKCATGQACRGSIGPTGGPGTCGCAVKKK